MLGHAKGDLVYFTILHADALSQPCTASPLLLEENLGGM